LTIERGFANFHSLLDEYYVEGRRGKLPYHRRVDGETKREGEKDL